MKFNKSFLFIYILFLFGCANTTTNQKGVDEVSEQIPDGKAIVLFDASIYDSNHPVLVIFKDLDRIESKNLLKEDNKIQFTNYPGKEVPFYAGDDPHRLHAYTINSGNYEISGCVHGAPERLRCIGGNWLNNGKVVGSAGFSVKGGEVINLGHLHINYTKINKRYIETVEIIDNSIEVDNYLKVNYPKYQEKIIFRPISFYPL